MRTFQVVLFFSTLFCSAAVTLDSSVPDNEFTTKLEVQGGLSIFDIDIYGIVEPPFQLIQAIRRAFEILADSWSSSVHVTTRVTFTDLGSKDTLASGGGVLFVVFEKSSDREFLPVAAAESISRRDLNFAQKGDDRYDILIKVNRGTPWHIDIGSSPSHHEYDLVTILLHETYHNLLFSGVIVINTSISVRLPVATLPDGYPSRFDLFLANENGCAVLDYLKDMDLANRTKASPEQVLAQSVTNNRLYFSDQATGLWVPLFSPKTYNSKSSIYHVDVSRGAEASFMDRSISRGFAHRKINEEMLRMQEALLDPSSRGAKHCSFPLSDPFEKSFSNSQNSSTESLTTAESGQGLSAKKGVTILLCIPAVVFILAVLFYGFSAHFKKDGRQKLSPLGSSRSGSSSSSSAILPEDGIFVDNSSAESIYSEIDRTESKGISVN